MRHPSPNHEAGISVLRASIHVLVAALAFAGCRTEHEIDVKPTHHTVKIEPIYMTVDINLRVQQELDAFYEDIVDEPGAQPEQGEEL